LLWSAPLGGKLPTCAGFSPDSKRLYACLFDGAGLDQSRWHADLHIWDTETGDLMLRLPGDRRTYFQTAKWVAGRIYVLNRGAITILDPSLEGLEDWEEADQRQAFIATWKKREAERRGRRPL
jgi:hypothetical protein